MTTAMKKIQLHLLLMLCAGMSMAQGRKQAEISVRQVWLNYMDKVARPVIANLADDELKEKCALDGSKDLERRGCPGRPCARYKKIVGSFKV